MNILSSVSIYIFFEILSQILAQVGEWPESVRDKGMGCVMDGICLRYDEPDEDRCKALNCFIEAGEDRSPPLLKDPEAISQLNEFCADTLKAYGEEPGGGYRLCCNPDIVAELSRHIRDAQNATQRCPTCWRNFRQVFCELTCSPYQIHFMEPVRVERVPVEPRPTDCGEQPPEAQGRRMITELRLFFTERYARRTYDSCKDMPEIDVLCGNYTSLNCSAENWFEFLGRYENTFTPFQVYFQYPTEEDEEITAFDGVTYRCNETYPGDGNVCSCADCEASCPSRKLYLENL